MLLNDEVVVCLKNKICGASLGGSVSAGEQHFFELSPDKLDCFIAVLQCLSV